MRTLVVHLSIRINTILCLSPQPTNFSLYKMTQVLSAFFWMFIMWVSIFLGLVRYRENKLGWASFNFFYHRISTLQPYIFASDTQLIV
jgi:hypothetical protein